MSVNKAMLVGRLGKNPEIRCTASGVPVATFSLATHWACKRNGETVQETEWHKIVAYERHAELCRDHLGKGSLVCVEGRIKTRRWEDRDGRTQKTTEIIAERISILGGNASDRDERQTTHERVSLMTGEDTP